MRVRPGLVDSLRGAEFIKGENVLRGECGVAETPNMRGCWQQRHTEEAAATKERSSQSGFEARSGRERANKPDKQEEKAKDQTHT